MRIALAVASAAMCAGAALAAAVGDPQIRTDHPYYQGELSCSTYERVRDSSYAHFASLPGGRTPENDTERLVALWAWRVAHHQHADGNLIQVGAGSPHADANGYMFCRDGLLGLFSHSTGLCFSIHAQFTPFAQMMTGDWRAAAASLVPGHTSFEAYTDGKWRWADMTCGSMFFQDRTAFDALGIQDMIDNGAAWCWLEDREGPLDLRLMPFGDAFFTSFVEADGKQKLFGYLGMPIVYVLKGGETFTRWSTPAGDDGLEVIWSQDYISGYNDPAPPYHGMARRETFLRYAPVGLDNPGRYGSDTSVMPLVSSCKGAFVYAPDLSSPTAYKDGVWSETNATTSGGWLHGDGGAGTVVFQHGSPYQIAAHAVGSPAGNWNVTSDACDGTAILSGTATGSVPVEVSLDSGATWTSIGTASGTFDLDFSEQVKGRFSYLIGLSLDDAVGLSAMSLRTVVQVGPAVFPMLKSGGSQVTFSPGGLGVVYGGPERAKAATFRDASKDTADKTAYKIVAPGPIRSLHGVASKTAANSNTPVSVETSVDGVTWDVAMPSVTLEPGANQNINSSIWGNGYLGFMWGYTRYLSTASTTGWIRFQNMDTTATQQVEVYATYELPSSANVEVTFDWTDGAGAHTDSHTFLASGGTQTWDVSTGADTVTNWVRFECLGDVTDADGDGMDDNWEVANFGDLSHDGGDDGDSDGAVDLHEYLEGTDPTEVGSAPDPGLHPGGSTASTLFREGYVSGDSVDGMPDDVVDTWLDEMAPTNDGRRSSPELRVEGYSGLGDRDNTLIWFDLTALPAEDVSHASMWLHYNFLDKEDGLSSANRMTTDWAGTDGNILSSPTTCWDQPGDAASPGAWDALGAEADFSLAGAAPGVYALAYRPDLASSMSGAASEWCVFDVTTIVGDWQDGTANYGFIVKLPDGSTSKHTVFDSSNNATLELRPILYVETGTTVANNPPVIAGEIGISVDYLQATFSVSVTDADSDALTYAWDFDLAEGLGFSDSSEETPSHIYAAAGTYLVAVRVTDGYGGCDYAVGSLVATEEPPPDAFDLAAPAGAGVTIPPTFTWNEAVGADTYALLVVADGDDLDAPASPVVDVTVDAPALTYDQAAAGVFAYGATYHWRVTAANTGGSTACNTDFTFTIEPDTYPPQIQSTSPADAEGGVSTSTTVTIVFDEPMTVATTAGAIGMTDPAAQPVDIGVPSAQNGDTEFVFSPASPLLYSTTYTVTVSTAAEDAVGNNLAAEYTFTFTTCSPPVAPRSAGCTPGAGAGAPLAVAALAAAAALARRRRTSGR